MTVSAPGTLKILSDVPAEKRHVAVPLPVSVLALVGSTAVKYLGGRAMVILPPMGTAVAVLKPNLMGSMLLVPALLNAVGESP